MESFTWHSCFIILFALQSICRCTDMKANKLIAGLMTAEKARIDWLGVYFKRIYTNHVFDQIMMGEKLPKSPDKKIKNQE